MVSSEYGYIEYLYILVSTDWIVFNDDINFQFDARAMTSQSVWLSDVLIKNSDSSFLIDS